MADTARDRIEHILLERFSGILKPLSTHDIDVINTYKDGSFGFSYLGIMLYANGCNEKGKSTRHPQGLLYYDGNTIFGVGYFAKNPGDRDGHLHIIAPRGERWLPTVTSFIDTYRHACGITSGNVYIRHIHEPQYVALLEAGCSPIRVDPWDVAAPSEDETYNHRYIALEDMISYAPSGALTVKSLVSDDTRNFKRKAKMAYNRFVNFLERNNATYQIEPYNLINHACIAKSMIVEHFRTLKNAVGSTPEDYFNLVNFMPDYLGSDFCGYIGYLVRGEKKLPVTFFMGEKIESDTMALYVTFALRNDETVRSTFDVTGYSAISQYAYIRVFDLLYRRNIRHVDLGGSEVEDLNNFKRQLGASEKKTYWIVCKNAR